MIIIEHIYHDLVRVKVTGPIEEGDFKRITSQVDALIHEKGNVRLLIDGKMFKGWKSFKAFKEHFNFAKNHHQKVKKIALIAGHFWQHWIAAIARFFVNPEIRVFTAEQVEDALRWVTEE